jgi:AcrR family transcriptional regulator
MARSNSALVKTARVHNPDATRQRVLGAATVEFARLGFAGARVDAIAERAKANKRMIYHYFGSKQALFLAALEDAYGDIRSAERRLNLQHVDPVEAIKILVTFTWDYYVKHPEFLTLVNNENLHKARHLKQSEVIGQRRGAFRALVADILKRGVQSGVFRPGVDADQLNLTIAAIGYYYLTNRFTNSIIYGHDLMVPAALKQRLAFNLETILRMIEAR